jgi:glyoxylase-like metal-dependent hydrolase (beta-lactamase superfamily II)/rhodanese-related sulfurtransferase
VLIDPVFEQNKREAALLRELGLSLLCTIETHVHADHVTGAWLHKETLGSDVYVSETGGAEGASRRLRHGEVLRFSGFSLEVRATPGHTAGCLSYYCPELSAVFTGDALLIRGAGRTDFQEGDAEKLFHSVRRQLFTLPDETIVYPGHDYSGRTSTTIFEEKRFNPRLGEHVREADFALYMKNLGLPHPKQLKIAVPANLRCGKPLSQEAPDDDWVEAVRTYSGVLQVEPEWVREHRDEVAVIDVRETAELEASPLGTIRGAQCIPLSELRQRATALSFHQPVITICPSGARSEMAAGILEKAGVAQVANLRGGVIEWHALGYPLDAARSEGVLPEDEADEQHR